MHLKLFGYGMVMATHKAVTTKNIPKPSSTCAATGNLLLTELATNRTAKAMKITVVGKR